LSRHKKPDRITVASVIAYADQIRRRAEAMWNPDSPTYDPNAKPPYPTTAAVRQLCTRMAHRALNELAPNATDDDKETAWRRGPELAMAELARRVSEWDRQRQQDDHNAKQSRQNLWRVQRRAERDREAQRAGLTLGQRIDQALATLTTIPAPAAAALNTDRVHGGHDQSPVPRFPGDPAARARAIARDTVRQLEDEVENAKRRRVELEEKDMPKVAVKAA
jgi:hypothetical protein